MSAEGSSSGSRQGTPHLDRCPIATHLAQLRSRDQTSLRPHGSPTWQPVSGRSFEPSPLSAPRHWTQLCYFSLWGAPCKCTAALVLTAGGGSGFTSVPCLLMAAGRRGSCFNGAGSSSETLGREACSKTKDKRKKRFYGSAPSLSGVPEGQDSWVLIGRVSLSSRGAPTPCLHLPAHKMGLRDLTG